MNSPFRLVCELEVLTPLFLGGADQKAELRVPSVKGVLRFWYRALDPDFFAREPLVFGSGGKLASQSLLALRCRPLAKAGDRLIWSTVGAKKFDQGGGRQTRNGLTYLGYPFDLKGNTKGDAKGPTEGDAQRNAFVPGYRFSLELTCLRQPSGKVAEKLGSVTALRAALATAWTVGHFGSLGSRARRGFGALALTGWRLEGLEGNTIPQDPDMAELPLLNALGSRKEWLAGAQAGLAVVEKWFGSYRASPQRFLHPHFGPRARFALLVAEKRHADWKGALLELGSALQNARQRSQPDYDRVKQHILHGMKQGGQRLERVPDRATFGLPLTFRYGSVPGGRPVSFTPVGGERHGSLLFLRPVLAKETLFGLCLRLDGAVPGVDSQVEADRKGLPLAGPEGVALDRFMDDLKGKS